MGYEKPKVTIDLDEYLDLKKHLPVMSVNELVVMYKKTLAAFINSRGDVASTMSTLKKEDILLSVFRNCGTRTNTLSYEDITIEKLNKNNNY